MGANCSSGRIEISGEEDKAGLSIEMRGTFDQPANFQFDRFDSCQFGLKPFTRIESQASALLISYQSLKGGLSFSLAFKAVSRQESGNECGADELRCSPEYAGLSHAVCLPADLFCACPNDVPSRASCRILVSSYAAFSEQNRFCENLLVSNKKCMAQKAVEERALFIGPECAMVNRSNEFGWLASPEFALGKPYAEGLDCLYRISLRHSQLVQLRFKYFSLGHGSLDAALHRTLSDYDYVNIYDGPSLNSPLIAHLTAAHNDFSRSFNGRVFNSRSNQVLIRFHSASLEGARTHSSLAGFNLTYQIKGLCIEDQLSCGSIYELNCFSPNQTCNDVWDCQNGADERGCGPCKPDQFRCRNHIFCYRLEDRCDGDHQCIDKSDELNCDAWFCNSANGTFLCSNGRCVYEQWVCDGTNDCEDGSDELNCPTPFTRRVITTAVLGGTLCCLLLVMALGCACKLYTLHTVSYRNTIRLSQTVQSAAAAAAAAPLVSTVSQVPVILTPPEPQRPLSTHAPAPNRAASLYNNFTGFVRRSILRSGNSREAPPLSASNISVSRLSIGLAHLVASF